MPVKVEQINEYLFSDTVTYANFFGKLGVGKVEFRRTEYVSK